MDNIINDIINELYEKSITITDELHKLKSLTKENIEDVDITYMENLVEHMNNSYEYIIDLKLLLNNNTHELNADERIKLNNIKNVDKVKKFFLPYMTLLAIKLNSME